VIKPLTNREESRAFRQLDALFYALAHTSRTGPRIIVPKRDLASVAVIKLRARAFDNHPAAINDGHEKARSGFPERASRIWLL